MDSISSLQYPVAEYLVLLNSIGSAATDCLPAAVYYWLEQCNDLESPRSEVERDPAGRWKRLRGNNPSSTVNDISARSYALEMYLSHVSNLIDSSDGRQRLPSRFIADRTPKTMDPVREIQGQIIAYAKTLAFEQALDFLVQLTAEWIMRCDAATVINTNMRLNNGKGLSENPTDAAINKLLLKWISYWFIDVH